MIRHHDKSVHLHSFFGSLCLQNFEEQRGIRFHLKQPPSLCCDERQKVRSQFLRCESHTRSVRESRG